MLAKCGRVVKGIRANCAICWNSKNHRYARTTVGSSGSESTYCCILASLGAPWSCASTRAFFRAVSRQPHVRTPPVGQGRTVRGHERGVVVVEEVCE